MTPTLLCSTSSWRTATAKRNPYSTTASSARGRWTSARISRMSPARSWRDRAPRSLSRAGPGTGHREWAPPLFGQSARGANGKTRESVGGPLRPRRRTAGSRKAQTVEQLAQSHPALRDQPWETWRIKDGEKGLIVWKVKHAMIHVKDERSLPTKCYHLLVCDNPLTGEREYFISNAPAKTPLKKLLRVAFSRWPIEHCFEEQKGQVGLTHWEGRTWTGLQRHLILTSVSHLFLAIACQKVRGKQSGGIRLPNPAGRQRRGAIMVACPRVRRKAVPTHRRDNPIPPGPKAPGPRKPHQDGQTKTETARNQRQHPEKGRFRYELAL